MKRSLKPALALAAVLAMIGGARSQPVPTAPEAPAPAAQCAPLPILRDVLKSKFHEIERSGGMIVSDQAALLIFTTPDGKTWTAVMAGPEKACIMTNGTGWYEGKVHLGDQTI